VRCPHVEPLPVVVRWRCQKKRQLSKDACEQNARGLETVGGKDPEALDRAPRGHVGIEDKPRSGKVDALAAVGTGQGGGDLAGAVVCGRDRRGPGAEGIPHPRGKRHYQGRIVVGHMRARGEAPA
jgi:hypothetical protein